MPALTQEVEIMKKFSQKTIGIIGGMGPQASAKLVQVVIDMAARDFGAKNDDEFPEIILNSVRVPNFISNRKNVKIVQNRLIKTVKSMEIFKPSCFAIACNTAHILVKDLQTETSVPFISIIDAVTKAVGDAKIKRIGLLGTPITISSGLYKNALAKRKIKVITPSKKDRIIVENVIRNVLSGGGSNVDAQRLMFVAESLRKRGAQGIILGCTELPLIFPKDFVIPVFDSIEILARALLKNVN
ncbi:MAG: hypothetical protein COX79_03705 [Candidatus Levybacteria bacterium CG_4_10_14_0_2_um_filter_36_16]|nr:MAG: hypothetical protein AUK12_05100 [Candidatus Levybacteria bacterium CG2_30_37_29]PIZ97052.1 MAG: hypothetical protein COX79_03705 [Candidatus Levybacteria bacterium CG_4_10_14_0_2_um_filter_36_16]